MPETTGRRTTLMPGRELDYERIHARIPDDVADALRSCGVISWHIWRDGGHLVHTVVTRSGYDAMLREITARGPIDAEWDRVIASLLESDPSADVVLPLVWSLDERGQGPGHVAG